MTEKEVQIRKWYFPWQDEAEERWLEHMAQKGLHFEKVTRYGLYTFRAGQPASMVYRLDYQNKLDSELGDYKQLFLDSGWEYAGEINSWRYFRKGRTPGETNEIFTDNRSKIEKYQRVLVLFAISLGLGTITIPNLLSALQRLNAETSGALFFVLAGFGVVCLAAYVLILVSVIQLVLRIRRLKETAS